MATVLDAMFMEIGIDTSKFHKQLAVVRKDIQELEKANGKLEDSNDDLAESLKADENIIRKIVKENRALTKEKGKLEKKNEKLTKATKKNTKSFLDAKKAVVGFIGALLVQTGIERMITNVTRLNTQLGYTSKNLGVSARDLKAWQNTAEMMGGSADEIISFMEQLSRAQTELRVTGQTAMSPYLQSLGVNLFDSQGNPLEMAEAMLKLADGFGKINRQEGYNFGQMMGINQGTLNMLLEGRDAVASTLAYQKSIRKVTDEEAAASMRLSAAQTKLSQQWEALENVLVSEITPALTEVLEWVTSIIAYLTEHKEIAITVFTSIAAIITATLIPALLAAAGAVWAIIAPFAAIIAIIGAVTAAAGLLWEDFNVWTQGGESALEGFYDKFAKIWKDAGRIFARTIGSIKKHWNDLMDVIRKAWKFILALFSGDRGQIIKAGKELAEAWAESFLSRFQIIKDAYNDVMSYINGDPKKAAGKTAAAVGKGGVKGARWAYNKGKEILDKVISYASPKAEASVIQPPNVFAQIGGQVLGREFPEPPSKEDLTKYAKKGTIKGVAERELMMLKSLMSAGITGRNTLSILMGQLSHESVGFKAMKEYASGDAYEGRKDLGNTQKGDGRRYKGRGFIQITGRSNYRRYGEIIGIDLENNPELAARPDIAARVAIAYMKDRKVVDAAKNGDVRKATKLINGGYNGFKDRVKRTEFYKNKRIDELLSLTNSSRYTSSKNQDTNVIVTVQKIEVNTTSPTISGNMTEAATALRNRVAQTTTGMIS